TTRARMRVTHFLMFTLPWFSFEKPLHVLAYNLARRMDILAVTPRLAAIRLSAKKWTARPPARRATAALPRATATSRAPRRSGSTQPRPHSGHSHGALRCDRQFLRIAGADRHCHHKSDRAAPGQVAHCR